MKRISQWELFAMFKADNAIVKVSLGKREIAIKVLISNAFIEGATGPRCDMCIPSFLRIPKFGCRRCDEVRVHKF